MPKVASSSTFSSTTTGILGTPLAKRACDQCNYRRIKCSREPKCDRCTLSKLSWFVEESIDPAEKMELIENGSTIAPMTRLPGLVVEKGTYISYCELRIKELQELSGDLGAEEEKASRLEPPSSQVNTNVEEHASGSLDGANNMDTTMQQRRADSASTSATSAQPFSPTGNGNNPLSTSSYDSSNPSHFAAMPPYFARSPPASATTTGTSQPFSGAQDMANLNNSGDVNHQQPQYGSSSIYSSSNFDMAGNEQDIQNINGSTSFFPSSTSEAAAAFPPDNFLTGLYDNIQPQSQQDADFSFLQSWPFWLSGTAANSPESAGPTVSSTGPDTTQQFKPTATTSAYNPVAPSQPYEVDWLSDSHLIPAIGTFFERLHPIMPIFTRSWILDRIDKDQHRSQSSLAGMLLALSSLAKIQPVKATDRTSRTKRNEEARALLEQSVKVRANVLVGQTHSLDEVLASFYTFATLFGMQEHNAATFRLREAITLAQLMKLNVHESYMFLDHAEQGRRLRTYWLLCITERAYALQRGDTVTLRGHPVTDMSFVVSGLPNNSFSDFPLRQLRLFDEVDEAFVDCWHGRCPRENCSTLTRERARLLHTSFGAIFPDQVDDSLPSTKKISPWSRAMIQSIDTTITSHWLQSRLWQLCLSHGLLSTSSQELIFRPAFVLQCAYQAYQFHVAADASSREAHGVGLIEKLFDIGMALLQARGLPSMDDALKGNIDQIISLYLGDLDNSSDEGKTFGNRLKAEWQAAIGRAAYS